MALLKTKTVKKCICGHEPKATFEWTDRDQAFTILLVLVIVGFIFVTVPLWSESLPESAFRDVLITGSILLVTLGYYVYLVLRQLRHGHKMLCAMRYALHKA